MKSFPTWHLCFGTHLAQSPHFCRKLSPSILPSTLRILPWEIRSCICVCIFCVIYLRLLYLLSNYMALERLRLTILWFRFNLFSILSEIELNRCIISCVYAVKKDAHWVVIGVTSYCRVPVPYVGILKWLAYCQGWCITKRHSTYSCYPLFCPVTISLSHKSMCLKHATLQTLL